MLYCDAYDPDVDDTMIYNWISPEGIFPTGNDRPAGAWQGPDVSGYYIISVVVSDGQDTDSSVIGIEVR